jgi:hypothetical protein
MTDVLDRLATPASDSDGPVATGPRRSRSRGEPVKPRKFRPDIEGMRAIAVVSVVLYHAGLGVRGGFVGVDVFFVISGYLITRQLLGSVGMGGIRSLPTFYSRRIKRLLPASATVVIVTVLAARIWASPLQARSIATDGIWTAFYGLNYHLAIDGTQYLHQDDAVSPLQHFWSLGVPDRPDRPVLPLVDPDHRQVLVLGLLLAADPRLGARAWCLDRRERRTAGPHAAPDR